MRPSLRFLALVVVGWAGIRSATLGSLPGSEMFRIVRSEAKATVPPIVPTQFPPIEPAQPYEAASASLAQPQLAEAEAGAAAPRIVTVPIYYVPASAPASSRRSSSLASLAPEP